MISEYYPIFVFMCMAFGLSLLLIALSYWRSKKNVYHEKQLPYECGFDPFNSLEENARQRFHVQFYLVGILFIIFDLEIALIFPWACVFKTISIFSFISMMMFISVLTIGFIYEWKKGALEWE